MLINTRREVRLVYDEEAAAVEGVGAAAARGVINLSKLSRAQPPPPPSVAHTQSLPRPVPSPLLFFFSSATVAPVRLSASAAAGVNKEANVRASSPRSSLPSPSPSPPLLARPLCVYIVLARALYAHPPLSRRRHRHHRSAANQWTNAG